MKHLRNLAFAAGMALAAGAAQASIVGVSNNITTDTRWTANNVYVLEKLIFVQAPAILTIEPGTIVRGERAVKVGTDAANPADPGALIVCRGAKIVANGTAESPIIFTSIDDPNVPGGTNTIPFYENFGATNNAATNLPATAVTNYQVEDLDLPENGFSWDARWGGVILLGRARISVNNPDGVSFVDNRTNNGTIGQGIGAEYIEGFQSTTNGVYGGTNDLDDSGVMRFCSIRYGGFTLTPDREINGLTMGGIGSETVVEFIEVFNNSDDSFEWFGGTVNSKYLASLFNGDDNFDTDEGWRGKNQYWFAIMDNISLDRDLDTTTGRQAASAGDELLEWDGGFPDNGNTFPYTIPTVYNFTLIGARSDKHVVGGDGGNGRIFPRRNSGGHLYNGIVMDSHGASGVFSPENNTSMSNRYFSVRSSGGPFNFPSDPSSAGIADLTLRYTSFWNIGNTNGATTAEAVNVDQTIFTDTRVTPILGAASNANTFTINPGLVGVDRLANQILDPTLVASSPLRTNGLAAPADGFFTPAPFRGAFRDNNWLVGWSVLEPLKVMSTNSRSITPAASIAVVGSNHVVTFTAESNVWYSVEYSTDYKTYVPFAFVTNTASGGTISVTNTALSVANFAGYRVIAQ